MKGTKAQTSKKEVKESRYYRKYERERKKRKIMARFRCGNE
jgi:hypothetical protein